MAHPVMWFEVLGTDGGTLRKFYGDLFGWTFKVEPGIDYGVTKTGDERGIMGGVGGPYPGTKPWVTFYTETPDVTASLDKATALGGRVVMPRTVLPDVVLGYRLQPGYDLPPLMFDREEIQALVLGARIVAQFGDPALARASESILSKVAGVLPKDLEPLLADTRLFVPRTHSGARSAAGLALAREAPVAQRRMHVKYANEKGEETERDLRPLGVFFWGKTWTLAAWCEMRNGFRNFRLDRIGEATLGERFEEEPGRTLRDMLAQYGPAAVRLLD